jgi:glycolate oxidase FAD binding subunit
MSASIHDHQSDPALLRLRDRIRQADASGTALRIRGGGTKDFYGGALRGEVLDTREYRGIVSYEPTELVLTARCGTPLAEIEAALAGRGQWLPFEPPAFGAAATLGGVVAAGLSGPGRQSAGAVRDFVLGAAMIDARGQALNFGGQVMKNVAGYDLSRLLCGSLGFLGLIAEVSIKVLPRPAASATLTMAIDAPTAVTRLNEWAGKPLPISASVWIGGTLALRLAGARAAVDSAIDWFTREHEAQRVDGDVDRFWAAVREQKLPFFTDPGAPLWRIALPSAAAPLQLPGAELIEWGGALRWWRTAASADTVRAAAASTGGHATLFRGGDRSADVFTPLAPALLELHRRLKAEFDPKGIFNPGRLVPGL